LKSFQKVELSKKAVKKKWITTGLRKRSKIKTNFYKIRKVEILQLKKTIKSIKPFTLTLQMKQKYHSSENTSAPILILPNNCGII